MIRVNNNGYTTSIDTYFVWSNYRQVNFEQKEDTIVSFLGDLVGIFVNSIHYQGNLSVCVVGLTHDLGMLFLARLQSCSEPQSG
ncbi:hypothetical protein GCM10027577_42580 [Spirosoma fluminis]